MGESKKRIAASSCHGENNWLGSCEAHHVSGSPQKDCNVSKSTMGKAESSTEEGRLEGRNSEMEATKVPLKEIKTELAGARTRNFGRNQTLPRLLD
jgi:hypothetical protein